MGILSKFKTLLKTNSLHRREADDDGNCLTHVRPASATCPRTLTATVESENVRPVTPPGASGAGCNGSPALRRVESIRGAAASAVAGAVPRIDSVTTKAMGGSRFETTIITRQGSRLVLQGVKTMKPDSDDDDEPYESNDSQPATPPPPCLPGAANGTPLRHAASPSPALSGAPAAAAALAGALPGGTNTASGTMPSVRRKPNRVASLPMLLDGGMPRAPPPMVAHDAPAPEYSGPQEPERKARRPPKRSESLKCLLHLDQYRFNPDESVLEAREAACGGAGGIVGGITAQGSLEDIISADGTTSSILAVSAALPARMRRPRWSLEDYQLLKQLHRGYASDVYQARCKISGEMVALKVYKLAEQGDIQRMQLYREIKLHAKLRHSNIVQYYACFLEQQRVVLVTEFATGGDLLRIMYKCGGRLFERQAVNLVLQPFLTALHYLHTQGIVHRDIKPENVLFAEGKILKLADFGLAINLKEERANTRAGTLDYMAPEVLRCPTKKTPDENKGNPQSAHYHQAVDAWAVGVFAYELIVGAPPFKAGQMIDTARNIMHAPVSFPETISDLAKDFITRALHKDCHERLTVLEMLHHPWITMFQRRSSVRIVYTRSNSLMELVPPPEGRTSVDEDRRDGRDARGGAGGGGASWRAATPGPAAVGQATRVPRVAAAAAAAGGGGDDGTGYVHAHAYAHPHPYAYGQEYAAVNGRSPPAVGATGGGGWNGQSARRITPPPSVNVEGGGSVSSSASSPRTESARSRSRLCPQ